MTREVERLATLEAEALAASKQREEIKQKLAHQDDDLGAIRKDVHEIKTTLAGHMGFLKGVIFVFTALGGAIGAAIAAFWDRLNGQ